MPGRVAIQTRKRRLRITAILALMIVAIGLGSSTPVLDMLVFDQAFSAEAWRKGDARTRGLMVRDLLRSGLLRGKTVAEIEELLGPGDVSGFDFLGDVPGYRVDIGYRWLFRPVQFTLWILRPMSKFFDETTEVSVRAAGMISDWHPFSSRRPRSLTCCT